ncbi:hypothetical protein AMJ47_03280 [Parcubacteria bacterium DG_72]|nr:MAG: hypothetical protein AMJ47_03280 [Parcubacteria bacterium DG_72]
MKVKVVIGLIIAFLFLVVLVALVLDKKFHIGFVWRSLLMRIKSQGPFPYEEVRKDLLPTAVCVDLGAFPKPLPNLLGIQTVVLMEDRSPVFFLSYDGYRPDEKVPLNRHGGPANDYKTQQDLKKLVQELHKQERKVLIGFWGFWADGLSRPSKWLEDHPELAPRRWDESDIGNPFAVLNREGISFAEYIANQYKKLYQDFGFDGLFLGDGLSGFRSFMNPERYRYKSGCASKWADFYRSIIQTVHETEGELWAYDCMGFSALGALAHGVDYNLLAKAGLDVLVFQTYPTAWAKYFKVPGKTGLYQDIHNFVCVRRGFSWPNSIRLYYTLEMGDCREGWWPTWEDTQDQMREFQKHADGKFLVWANETIANLGR